MEQEYELGPVLGRGGFGIVYKAVCRHPDVYGQEVAVKMVGPLPVKSAKETGNGTLLGVLEYSD